MSDVVRVNHGVFISENYNWKGMIAMAIGARKTRNMTKIFGGLNIDAKLERVLAKNQLNAEHFQRIETLCKDGLRKGSSMGDAVAFSSGGDVLANEIAENGDTKAILKGLNISIEDWSCNIVHHALFDNDKGEIVFLPKKRRSDVQRLCTAAGNEKRRLKLIQKKILDALKQYEKFKQKAQTMVDKIVSEDMAKGLRIDNYRKEIHKSSANFRKFTRYKNEYDALVTKITRIKHGIRKLLADCGCSEDEINPIYDSLKYPLLNVDKLKEMITRQKEQTN